MSDEQDELKHLRELYEEVLAELVKCYDDCVYRSESMIKLLKRLGKIPIK